LRQITSIVPTTKKIPHDQKANKISTRWISETRGAFRDFFDETNFPDPERLGERGSKFMYPEWLIMFIVMPYLPIVIFRPKTGGTFEQQIPLNRRLQWFA